VLVELQCGRGDVDERLGGGAAACFAISSGGSFTETSTTCQLGASALGGKSGVNDAGVHGADGLTVMPSERFEF
jgi:hypothetical protein